MLTCTLGQGRHRVRLSHWGDGHFAVWVHGDNGGTDLLVNKIGAYSGTVLVEVGTGIFAIAPGGCSIEVTADGRWRVELLLP